MQQGVVYRGRFEFQIHFSSFYLLSFVLSNKKETTSQPEQHLADYQRKVSTLTITWFRQKCVIFVWIICLYTFLMFHLLCFWVQLADVLQEVREEVQCDHEKQLEQLRKDHRKELDKIRHKYLEEVRRCLILMMSYCPS